MRTLIRSLATAACLLPVLAWPAQPEVAEAALATTGIVPLIEDGKRIYLPGQFQRFAPQTAADLVQQIPGFTITQVSSDRGLGEASQNVLINGQRITGKGNDAQTVLRRIPVAAVIRMELVDAATLDISGLSGHVLDVLTEPDAVQGNFAWRPQIRERIWDHWPAGEVNVSGKSRIGDFSLGVRWDGFRGGGWGGETEYRPATGISFWRAQQPRFANDIPRLTGSLNRRTAAGSIWNVNASVERQHFRRRVTTLYQRAGEPLNTEVSTGRNIKWRTEVGSDVELALGAGRLKLVGLFAERVGPNGNELTTQAAGVAVPSGSRFTRESTEGERVGRGEYRWKALGADWTLSAEGAFNFIDATGELEALDAAGQYQPVALDGATSRVEEARGESILSMSRPLGNGWSLQVSGGAEYSRLQQDGAGGRTRSFWRPKGAVSMAWNPASRWEMNLRLQRKVGQLNFFDFLANVDTETSNANGGNPELVPPQSWILGLETIRNLGSAGKLRMLLEAEDISDIVEQVPISPTLESPGNLPKARRLQATVNAGLLLDGIGISGGKLDLYGFYRDTRVRDPVLGTHRRLNGNWRYWSADFRHDVPGTAWTWGLFADRGSPMLFTRLDFESRDFQTRAFTSAYLEHKDVAGLKVRVTVANLFNTREGARQVSYLDRRDGPVDYTRDYLIEFGRIYRLQVSGTF